METNGEKMVLTGKEATQFKVGENNNPEGRPKGSLNFKTQWLKAIKKLAEANNTDEEEILQSIILAGINKAKKGDFAFYRDMFDRIDGKAVTRLAGPDGEPLFRPSEEEKAKVDAALDEFMKKEEPQT